MMRKLEVTIDGIEFESDNRNIVTRVITVTQEKYEQYFLPFINGDFDVREERSKEIIEYFEGGMLEFFDYVDEPDWDWMVTKVKEVA